MISSVDTASLRHAAGRWSLAGDKRLLEALEKIHQKIMNKCSETSSSLSALTSALDDADVALQSVNNRMMSLSNSQFVESRVYDDEVAVVEDTAPKEGPKAELCECEVSILKRGIGTLERMHSLVEILGDSDTDSDTDSDAEFYTCRVVLKPNDMYSERPLPHIIGSHGWKTKWHAGLYPEESETETESESEVEMRAEPRAEARPNIAEPTDRPISTCSSVVAALSPAEVAADVARRLAGGVPSIPEREIVYTPPQPTSTKEYKPQPIAVRGPIFLDEPPPLEQTDMSDEDNFVQEDDIFAELHKNKPNVHSNITQSSVTDDLFGDISSNVEVGLFGRARENKPKTQLNSDQDAVEKETGRQEKDDIKSSAKQKSTLFDAEIFAEQSDDKRNVTREGATQVDIPVKKPVGGISLFGNKKGAESIGAAILKRNQRKSSISSDEREDEALAGPKEASQPKTEKHLKSKQSDLLENLFTKPEKKKPAAQIKIATEAKKIENLEKKIDLFSDNLFDDIDDIFTSNVVVKIPKKEIKKNEKSIFEDEDDLFADIAVSEASKQSSANVNIKKDENLFDSDDELFSETNAKNPIKEPSTSINAANDKNKLIQSAVKPVPSETKTLFDTSSDDDIFLNKKPTHSPINKESYNTKESQESIFEDNKTRPIQTCDFNTSKNPKQTIEFLKNEDQNETFSDQSKHTINDTISSDDNSQQLYKHLIKPTEINHEKETEFAQSISDTDLVRNYRVEPIDKHMVDTKDIKVHDIDDDTKLNKVSSFKSPSIFDDEDDDLFQTQIVKEELSNPLDDPSKYSVISCHNTEISVSVVIKPDENEQNIIITNDADSNITVTNKKDTSTALSDPEELLFNKTDTVSDIIDEPPPVFEKPKEPKKSKNINALFDDDSDDEALFFKRNDVDEKIEDITSQSTDDKLFDIFHDEPPDIDIDFTQKPKNSLHISKNLVKTSAELSGDNLIQTHNVKDILVTPTTLEETDGIKLSLGDTDSRKEIQIGKLKPTNLNININTLLPGASPKRHLRAAEQIDGQSFSTNAEVIIAATSSINKEISNESTKTFEESNPEILDNKFSKHRAKIQIKRRPSTRQARREAVRKSIIDMGDDSTDNSSSIDDTPKTKQVYQIPKEENFNKTVKTSVQVTSKTVYILNDEDIFSDANIVTNNSILKNTKTDINKDLPKTKTLQIIDDDDIFKTIKGDSKLPVIENNVEESINTRGTVDAEKPRVVEPVESIQGNILRDTHIRETNKETPIIEKEKEPKIKEKSKKSLFDDLSDEESELFGGTKTLVKSKTNIVDSKSENQLFSGTSKKETVKKKDTVEVKSSLFGDDDDEDLFSVKDKTKERSRHQKPSSSVETNNPNTIQDPLSTLLGDD